MNKRYGESYKIYEETPSGKKTWRVPTSYKYDWSGDANWDIVTRKLGGKWRTPTPDELYELRYECRWTPMRYKGVQGYAVSNGDGSKSIFIGCHTPKGSTTQIHLATPSGNGCGLLYIHNTTWPNSKYTYYLSACSEVNDFIGSQKSYFEAYCEGDARQLLDAEAKFNDLTYSTLQLSTSGNLYECTVDNYKLNTRHNYLTEVWMFPVRPVCDK